MAEWRSTTDNLDDPGGRRIYVSKGDERVTFADILALLRTDAKFRKFFNDMLAETPFAAFRWETPFVCRSNVDDPFECVTLESRELLCPPEQNIFDARFGGRRAPEVLGFPNLGGDAYMVVPCPGKPLSAYAHLGAFVRHASDTQSDRLWQEVGNAVTARLSATPIWLNTAGAGVAWLHVRLDSRPKYYCYAPYRHVLPRVDKRKLGISQEDL